MAKHTPQDKPSRDGTRERISGPFKGYHVVALGCFVGGEGNGFRGFYKICRDQPSSYWTAECLAQGRCGPESSSGVGALRMAESAAAVHLQAMRGSMGRGSPAVLPIPPNEGLS